jgi:hypothetical protein
MSRYQKKLVPHSHYARTHPPTPPVPLSPLQGSQAGERCPRRHCGGLLIQRAVVTVDGSCEELVCSSCARSTVLRVLEPYVPIPEPRDQAVSALLVPDREAGAGRGSDDSMGIPLPPSVRVAVGLHRGWSDESLPVPPLDRR